MNIGEQIRIYRKKAGLSQKELGIKLGVSQQNIAQYENGLRTPKIETIFKIAESLDVFPSGVEKGDSFLSDEFLTAYVNSLKDLPKKERNLATIEFLKKYADIGGYKFEHVITTPYIEHLEAALRTTEQLFKKLNKKGQDKAVEQIELLTKIPEYQREEE